MSGLTVEEKERLAFIKGDVARAELLSMVIDAEDAARGMQHEQEDSYQAGWADGHAVGMEEGKRLGYERGLEEGAQRG